MYKIAVVGDYDSIYGFAALGLSVFPADDRETLCAVLRRLAESGIRRYLYHGVESALVQDVIEEYRERRLPAVILIPGVSGNTGAGIAQVKKSVEQAVAPILYLQIKKNRR